jgi:uncharacterized protein
MPDDLTIPVRVTTRASKGAVVGMADGVLKIRVTSPPVDGAANSEIVALLANHFGISKSRISIIAGETSRNKRIKFENLSSSELERRLL